MTNNNSVSSVLLAMICIGIGVASITVIPPNNLFTSIYVKGMLYDIPGHYNNYDSSPLQMVSNNNEEEENGNEDICNRYLETCPNSTPPAPTLTPPPPTETIDEASESIRERYLDQTKKDDIITTNATAQPGSAPFKIYRNDAEKMSLQYPSDWQISEQNKSDKKYPAVVTFYSPYDSDSDAYVEVVDVTAQNLSDQDKNINPEQYVAKVISSYRQESPGFKVVEANPNVPFGVKDMPGYKLVFTMTDKSNDNKDTELKVTETGTIDNEANKAFFIRSYVENNKYLDYLPVTEKMANSFELLK